MYRVQFTEIGMLNIQFNYYRHSFFLTFLIFFLLGECYVDLSRRLGGKRVNSQVSNQFASWDYCERDFLDIGRLGTHDFGIRIYLWQVGETVRSRKVGKLVFLFRQFYL